MNLTNMRIKQKTARSLRHNGVPGAVETTKAEYQTGTIFTRDKFRVVASKKDLLMPLVIV